MKKFALLSIFAMALLVSACGPQQSQDFSDQQKQQIKDLVRQSLQENPKMVLEALEAHQKQAREEAAENSKKAISSRAAEIFSNSASPIMGNPNGNVNVVEFFDYNCGYCKAVFHPIRDAVLQDGNVKFIFKEFPILGDSSILASKAALAAAKQGKYVEYHTALMDFKAAKDLNVVMDMANKLGLNMTQFQADMNGPEVQQILDANYNLGKVIGVNGTPAFIIGDKFYPGAMDPDAFKKVIADYRASKSAAPAAPANPAAPAAK